MRPSSRSIHACRRPVADRPVDSHCGKGRRRATPMSTASATTAGRVAAGTGSAQMDAISGDRNGTVITLYIDCAYGHSTGVASHSDRRRPITANEATAISINTGWGNTEPPILWLTMRPAMVGSWSTNRSPRQDRNGRDPDRTSDRDRQPAALGDQAKPRVRLDQRDQATECAARDQARGRAAPGGQGGSLARMAERRANSLEAPVVGSSTGP